MPTRPFQPGAYVQEAPKSPPSITGVPTSVAAFVGYTATGLDHQAQPIASLADFGRLYGGLAVDSELGYAVQHFFQNGGTQAVVVRTPGADGGLPGTADILGDQAVHTGIYALLQAGPFNLLCIPDAVRAAAGDPGTLDAGIDPNAIYGAAMTLCKQQRAFLLVDPPPDLATVAAAADWKSRQLAVTDPDGAAFFPRLALADPLRNGQLRNFAPSGVVAGVYARTDANQGVWKSPAGTAAVLQGVQGMGCQLSDADNALLNTVGLNCFRTFPSPGPVLWGARTLAGADAMASQWKYVAVRRTALFLEQSIVGGTQWAADQPNGPALWAALCQGVGTFLQSLFLKGAFAGGTPAQAYFVRCDSGTTSQSDIDNGVVNIQVGFAGQKPAEFLILQIAQQAARPGAKPLSISRPPKQARIVPAQTLRKAPKP